MFKLCPVIVQRCIWLFIESFNMWYFVEKNGRAVKGFKMIGKALFYAYNKLSYNSEADVVRIVDNYGVIYEEF